MFVLGNLEKQIKRHVVAQRHHFFAVTAPGLEAVCRDELNALGPGVSVEETVTGGVAFSGRLSDLYQANLWLRSAGRILLRIGAFKAIRFDQLVQKTATIAWGWYLPQGALPVCRATSHRSRLYHSEAVAERVQEAISDYWKQAGITTASDPDQTLMVRLENDVVTLSLDSSGPNLYKRGLKQHTAHAPLRETLAAGILLAAGYQPHQPLIDPMCGAGTFSLEAALIAKRIPPGAQRTFACMQWPAFRPQQWQYLKTAALAGVERLPQPLITASDIDADACTALADCVHRHALDDAVRIECRDFFAVQPAADSPKGMVVLNPPYGRRLMPSQNLKPFYGRIGRRLKQVFTGWRVALVVPYPELVALLPSGLTPLSIVHGGLSMVVLTGKIA